MKCEQFFTVKKVDLKALCFTTTLESGIDVGQGISVGPGNFGKNSKRRASKIYQKE